MSLRRALQRLRARMGRWIWVLVALLVPVFIHEADHLYATWSILTGSAYVSVPFTHALFEALWPGYGSEMYHNSIVILGGFAIILLLWSVAKE